MALFLAFFAQVTPSESTARWEGVVLDQTGGTVSGATVNLISPDKIREVKTNDLGNFEFFDIPSGMYDLTILRNGFRPYEVENFAITSSDVRPLSFTLQLESPPPCWRTPSPSYEQRMDQTNLSGTVKDANDGHVQRVAVKITFLDTGQTHTALTGKRGEFQFRELEPGQYTLTVTHAHYWYPGKPIKFWIARENLTRFANISVLNNKTHPVFLCQ